MDDPSEEARLTDLVILGRAAPEEMADGRQTACTGAWSPTKGFIRLYPVDPGANLFSRWDIVDAKVERNPRDARHESWQIKGRQRDQRERVEVTGEVPRERRATILTHLEDDCVNVVNDAKRSLGIIRPESIDGLHFEEWDDDDAGHVQAKLFEEADEPKPHNRDDFEYNIKLQYRCPNCLTKQQYHRQTLLEWGGYMGLKNLGREKLRGAYRFEDDDYNHWLFVGNLNQHKNSFIVISIIPMKNDVPIYGKMQAYPKVAPDFEPADS